MSGTDRMGLTRGGAALAGVPMKKSRLMLPRRVVLALLALTALPAWAADAPRIHVSMSFDKALRAQAVNGRAFLMIGRKPGVEPRLTAPYTFAYYFNDPSMPYAPIYGMDVNELAPGQSVSMDETTPGYPFASLRNLPPGDYTLQAVLNVYTLFKRADGHSIYAHADRGEGQQFHVSPGNLVSEPVTLHIDPAQGIDVSLKFTRTIPEIKPVADTRYVKRVRFKSALISRFWGHDMWFSAIVVLPKGYDEHKNVRYPLVFHQGHFQEGVPFGFSEQAPPEAPADASPALQKHYRAAKAFHEAWQSESLPRMILVSLQHPTPFYDDSYLVNSANNGPWEDALFKEMLPFLEAKFRIIRKPYARVLTGGSTGGWISAALQIRHPREFGGAWSFCPDPVDFREFLNSDLYKDESAFTVPGYDWVAPERFMSRTVKGEPRVTVRSLSQISAVLGSNGRSGEFLDMWSAVYGPVGTDGYPRLIWDHGTGKIDHEVAEYWRSHDFDLRDYLERNWSQVGPNLVGKLHFICGDMDNFYLNLSMYRLEEFLKSAKDTEYGGSFTYGRPMIGHEYYGYDPWPIPMLEEMAATISRNAPAGDDPSSWRYR